MTNGCKGIRRGNQMSSLYFAAQVETKANFSHPFCAFPLLDSIWSCLALPGKEKSLPQQKASQDLCYQPTNHKEGKRVFFFLRSRPKTGLYLITSDLHTTFTLMFLDPPDPAPHETEKRILNNFPPAIKTIPLL